MDVKAFIQAYLKTTGMRVEAGLELSLTSLD